MKRLILLLPLLLLLGCSGKTAAEQVAQVQAATKAACGFLPTASSVAAILSAGNPAVVGVSAVAAAICEAVTKPSAQTRSVEQPCPKVNGVCVEGEFVPKDESKPVEEPPPLPQPTPPAPEPVPEQPL